MVLWRLTLCRGHRVDLEECRPRLLRESFAGAWPGERQRGMSARRRNSAPDVESRSGETDEMTIASGPSERALSASVSSGGSWPDT